MFRLNNIDLLLNELFAFDDDIMGESLAFIERYKSNLCLIPDRSFSPTFLLLLIMAHGLFTGSLSSEENLISTARRGSISFLRRPSQAHVHELFMHQALIAARTSLAEGGIPIGCVLVRGGQIVARGHNRRVQKNSAILQAEMDCLEAVGRQPASFYHDCTMYTTLSPSAMSAGAIRFYGIPRVVIGDNKTYHGDEALLRASGIQVDVLDSHECQEIIENFIKENPLVWSENIAR